MAFTGFAPAALEFLAELARNNNQFWFHEHKARYEELLLAPAKELVLALGARLKESLPGLHADPRVNRSIFRIYRDTRFSADKTPYKTNLALWFWEGEGPRMECAGFYVHLEPTSFYLGAGFYLFPKPALAEYRRSVADRKLGPALLKAVEAAQAQGPYELGGQQSKRVPTGFPADHPRSDLLRRQGLYLGLDGPPPAEVHGPELVDLCLARLTPLRPFHEWLKGLAERARAQGD